MTHKKSLEIYRLNMSSLQLGFSIYCRILGIRKSTCIALTLMLNSKPLLIAMLKFMAEIEACGNYKVMDHDDITTMVVTVASKLKDCWDKNNG